MTYLEQAKNAYRDSLLGYGVSEEVIKFSLASFETGFSAGTLHNEDIAVQLNMVKTILNENNLN